MRTYVAALGLHEPGLSNGGITERFGALKDMMEMLEINVHVALSMHVT